MKENLQTFPTGRSIWAYQRWKENFEKELRNLKLDLEEHKNSMMCIAQASLLKEILGDASSRKNSEHR
jgi:hypothetical protein